MLNLRRALFVLMSVGLFVMPAVATADDGSRRAPAASDMESTMPDDVTVLQETDTRLIATLPNGLVMIAERIPTAPVVSVQSWVKTGSIYEQQHNGAGLSHFLEHLLSGGTTENRTEEQSNAILGRIGARTNAATSLDTVRYYINTASEHTDTAIDLLSDWMLNAKITETEFQRERQVIQREFDMGRGEPNRIFWKLTQQARYQAHPARHPTIGYLDEFLTITRDEIRDFYQRMYVPNNMVFVVTGDIDREAVVRQVAERWRDAERGDLPDLSFPVEPPAEATERTGHADINLPRLRLAWPGTRLGGEHDYAMDLLAQVLGQGELSRLVRTVRDEQQHVTQISAFNLSFDWGEGFFAVNATTTEDKIDAAREAILEQIERIKNEGITEDELARAKRKTVARVVFDAQTAQAAASRLARDFIAHGDPDYLDRYAEAIQRITAEDVQAAANALLVDEHLLTLKLLPSPDQPQAMQRPDDPETDFPTERVELDNRHLVETFRAVSDRAGEDVEPTVTDEPRVLTLDNGLRVILRRDTRLPIVAMQWYHLGGLLADDADAAGTTNAMASMLIKGATDAAGNRRTGDDIARFLEQRGAEMSTACGYNTFYVTARALADDAPEVLRLMSDVITRPTFPAEEWASMQPRIAAQIRSIDDRWSGELSSAFNQAWFGDHPWAHTTAGDLSVVEALQPADLAAQHEQLLNAGQSVLAVVGDFDPDAMTERIEAQFGSMPASTGAGLAPPTPAGRPDGRKIIETSKPMAAVQMGFGPAPRRDHADFIPMEVLTKVVSNFPSGWLQRALRGEGQGLVYAAWGYQRTGIVPGYWTIAFNTAPAQAERAIDESLRLVQRLRAEPVDDATLQRARSATLVSEMLGRQSYGQQAQRLALDELYGLGYEHADRFADAVRDVTAADVRAMAEKYLSDQPLILIMSDEPIDASGGEAGEEEPEESTSAPAAGAADG